MRPRDDDTLKKLASKQYLFMFKPQTHYANYEVTHLKLSYFLNYKEWLKSTFKYDNMDALQREVGERPTRARRRNTRSTQPYPKPHGEMSLARAEKTAVFLRRVGISLDKNSQDDCERRLNVRN